MNTISRTVTGMLAISFGLVIIIFAIFDEVFLLFYGIPIFILGFFILFNEKEDEIEGIKEMPDNMSKDSK